MQTYEFGNPDASVVLIEPIHTVEGMANEAEILRKLAGNNFLLRAVAVDWFRDLSPWPAPPVFGDTAFGDGAQETLEQILKLTGEPGKQYVLGGYSMGGMILVILDSYLGNLKWALLLMAELVLGMVFFKLVFPEM